MCSGKILSTVPIETSVSLQTSLTVYFPPSMTKASTQAMLSAVLARQQWTVQNLNNLQLIAICPTLNSQTHIRTTLSASDLYNSNHRWTFTPHADITLSQYVASLQPNPSVEEAAVFSSQNLEKHVKFKSLKFCTLII